MGLHKIRLQVQGKPEAHGRVEKLPALSELAAKLEIGFRQIIELGANFAVFGARTLDDILADELVEAGKQVGSGSVVAW